MDISRNSLFDALDTGRLNLKFLDQGENCTKKSHNPQGLPVDISHKCGREAEVYLNSRLSLTSNTPSI